MANSVGMEANISSRSLPPRVAGRKHSDQSSSPVHANHQSYARYSLISLDGETNREAGKVVAVTETNFDTERAYDDRKFNAVEVFKSDRMKVVCGYFEPGQFIPVHAPSSDVAIHVHSGTGRVRDGDDEHAIEPGDVVVVEADTDRGIKADKDSRLEAFLVTAPPPTDAEHDPVREGIKQGEFDPRSA